jgi:drug/metabolite transporter (DMT)-like permease
MIEALWLGDASLISPFRYTAIMWATLSGFFIWHHLPDSLTMFGAALLIVSGIIIAGKDKRRSKVPREHDLSV